LPGGQFSRERAAGRFGESSAGRRFLPNQYRVRHAGVKIRGQGSGYRQLPGNTEHKGRVGVGGPGRDALLQPVRVFEDAPASDSKGSAAAAAAGLEQSSLISWS